MNELVVYIDRLNHGESQAIEETLDPIVFFGLEEAELDLGPCTIKGSAYLGGDYLVLQFNARFELRMPCNICGNAVKKTKELKNVYLTQDLEKIKANVYPFGEDLRELLLLEIPPYIECSGGSCPERATIKPFLKKEEEDLDNSEVYYPFKDL